MRILVAGGTGFLGGACVSDALAKGHAVTVLTRSGDSVPDGARAIIADRCAPLSDLRGQFDAVIDTSAYQPAMVTHLTRALADPLPYVFVSSISAYDSVREPGQDETAPATTATQDVIAKAAALPHARWTDISAIGGENYGPLKVACEANVTDWSNAASLIRLGLIVGPGDKTDRMTWWVRRCDAGGAIPVPGPAERTVQLIDVGDAAAFCVDCAVGRISGTFNVTGRPLPLRDLVKQVIAVAGSDGDVVPVDPAAIDSNRIAWWTDYPLVLPLDRPTGAMMEVATQRAEAAGLRTRSLEHTITAILDWDRGRRDRPLSAGLSAAQEAALLASA